MLKTILKCLWRDTSFLEIGENKNTDYLNKEWLCDVNVIKFIKVTSNSIRQNAKSIEKQKTNFPKESVKNTDLYKPVFNKIITTHEYCMKYNFVTPLIDLFYLSQGDKCNTTNVFRVLHILQFISQAFRHVK